MSVTAYDRVRAARGKNRPTGLDYIRTLFDIKANFFYSFITICGIHLI